MELLASLQNRIPHLVKTLCFPILVLIVIMGNVWGNPVICQEPSEEDLHIQFSTLQAERNYSNINSLEGLEITESTNGVQYNYKYGTRTCPRDVINRPDVPLEDRATCPWHNRVNHDPTRYPVDLVEAYCLCQSCSDNGVNECNRVYYTVPVLRKTATCKNGVYVYKATLERVATGCTCARPRIGLATSLADNAPILP